MWDLSGIPCGHAIAAIYSKGWSPEDFVFEWYTQKKFMEAYEVMLQPIAGAAKWEVIERPIAPPLHRRQPGRPRTKRTKELGEEPPAPGTEKFPRSHYTQVECEICGKKGHNKKTCVRRNEGANERVEPLVAEANVENDVPDQQQLAAEDQMPTHESNFEVSSVFPNQNHVNQQGTENVNVNVNLNVNFTVNADVQDEGDIYVISQGNNNVVQPNSQATEMSQRRSIGPFSSGKKYKMSTRRIKPTIRKSTRLATASSQSNQTVQVPKSQVQRRLWRP